MADARLLRKKISEDVQVAQLSTHSALLYVLSIPHLDVDGRMNGLPAHVRGTVVPEIAQARPQDWTDQLVAAYMLEWTSTLDDTGDIDPLVLWYATEGKSVCFFTGFASNQNLRRERESPSRLPAPPPALLEQPAVASARLAEIAQLRSSSGADPGQEVRRGKDLPAGLSVARGRCRQFDNWRATARGLYWKLLRGHRTETCQHCGRPVWLAYHAPDWIWEAVTGRARSAGGEAAPGILCPRCLDDLAKAKGLPFLRWTCSTTDEVLYG